MPRRPIPPQKFAAMARQMYDDPDLTGDVLALALVMLESMTRFKPAGAGDKSWTADLAERVSPRGDQQWVRWAIRQDLPRHVALGDGNTCIGTMIRRPTPCGRPSSRRFTLYDALSGERTWVGSCHRHHREVEMLEVDSRKAWVAAGSRPGPQNAGGVLERYFSSDWDKVYQWAQPSWKRPGAVSEPPRRPHLTLIAGGLDLVDEDVSG